MKVVDLFCGAGGSALGASRNCVQELYCFDNAPRALSVIGGNCSVFSKEGGSVVVENRNLLVEPVVEINDVDLLIAGPPCQPFSLGGRRNGFDDIRSGFESVLSTIRACAPRAFIVENVEGISLNDLHKPLMRWLSRASGVSNPACETLSGRSGSVLGSDYLCAWKIMNTADYGLPQLRKRWILVGIRRDLALVEFQWPTPTHSSISLYNSQLMDSSYWISHDLSVPKSCVWFERGNRSMEKNCTLHRWRTCRDVIASLQNPVKRAEGSRFEFGHFIREGARKYRGHSGSWVDLPAKTIKAGAHGVPGGENTLRFRNGRLRYMTLLECALIQGFPSEFRFHGSFSEMMKMIGNACPPVLVDVIVKELIRQGVVWSVKHRAGKGTSHPGSRVSIDGVRPTNAAKAPG